MKLLSMILLLSCLFSVAMSAVNLRAEKPEDLSRRTVKDARAKGVSLGAQLNAAYDAALSVRNLVASKASEHSDGWLGVALEFRRADSLEGFLGVAAADDVDAIDAFAESAVGFFRELVINILDGEIFASVGDTVAERLGVS